MCSDMIVTYKFSGVEFTERKQVRTDGTRQWTVHIWFVEIEHFSLGYWSSVNVPTKLCKILVHVLANDQPKTNLWWVLLSLSNIKYRFNNKDKILYINLFTPTSDQDRISPYNIGTISSRQVMRIEKNINYGIISWSNTKFSELTT